MKAVVMRQYGSPDVLQVQDVPLPQPEDHQVRVRVKAAGVTTADTFLRKGTPYFARLFVGILKPKASIPGTCFAGVIDAVGKAVKHYHIGDRVYGMAGMNFGANAEYVCIDATGVIQSIPENISFDEASPLCDGAMTAFNFLRNIATLEPGQRVLINGTSGSVGSAAVQIAKHFGAHVTGVCGPANMDWVKSLGADEVINYHQTDFTQNGMRYDIIFDAVGKRRFKECQQALSSEGEYISPVLNFNLFLQMLWTRKFSSKKAKFSSTGMIPIPELNTFLKKINMMIQDHQFISFIDKRYSIEKITEAHQYLDSGHKRGNIILALSNDM